jgi:hypothetical protein
MLLLENVHDLEILVRFKAQPNKTHTNNSWFDSIKLVIDYGTVFEFSGGMQQAICFKTGVF